ncbi:MAG: 50S ribosomal protein L13e [Desulfurococcales archaeon ex4484_42]|nr:MAG: 50S ribosomal protein L13e [Desulfurococcales archaeon ex4484_42]
MGEVKVIDLEGVKPVVKSPRILKFKTMEVGTRVGRGFSEGELREVGLTLRNAKKLGLPIDKRRRSVRKENVEILKKFLDELCK